MVIIKTRNFIKLNYLYLVCIYHYIHFKVYDIIYLLEPFIIFCYNLKLELRLHLVLWQLLITKTNDYTSGKSLRVDIKWEFHKRTRQGVSA